jgi:hypothetical protein
MNCCAICTLIFDAEPTTIGRSESNPDICILCAEDLRRQERNPTMYTIEPQRVTKMEAVIRLDETAIAATIADPAPLIADLRNLLKSWSKPVPSPATKLRGKARKGAAKLAPKKIAERKNRRWPASIAAPSS